MDILTKIKKLLALSASPNANEAATALARAQALMVEYGIDKEAVSAADIVEEKLRRVGGRRPPKHEVYFVSELGRTFGCRVIHGYDIDEGRFREIRCWIFIGPAHRTKICTHMATVLLRKLRSCRAEYVKTLYRCRPSTKVRRADAYCLGWVFTVVQKLSRFAGSPEDEAAMESYMKRYDDLQECKAISREAVKRSSAHDYRSGYQDGQRIELQHGMSGAAGPAMIGA